MFSFIFLISIFNFTFSQATDGFCFDSDKNLKSAVKDVQGLFSDGDKVLLQEGSFCFDLVTSSDLKLSMFEKLLMRRYQVSKKLGTKKDSLDSSCQVTFETVTEKEVATNEVRIGPGSTLSKSEAKAKETTTQSFIVTENEKGRIGVCFSHLEVICRKINENSFLMKLSYGDFSKQVETTVTLNKDTKLDLGNVIKDLNNKMKTLGFPETSWIKTEGFESVSYSLSVK